MLAAVIDLQDNAPRLPADMDRETEIEGIKLARFFHKPHAKMNLAQRL